jgi:tetratricopeptide (TPR) repeat protein
MSDICPELYINEAEIIINSINIFDYICCRKRIKYENIANLYKNAGNLYKMKDLNLSYESYEKSLYYYSKISDNNQKNIADCYINCALTCDKQYHQKIINYYTKAIDIYLSLELYNKIPKFYENIADIYLSINDFNNSILYYEKVCEILEKNYESDTYDSILKKEEIYNKLGTIYIVNMNNYDKGLTFGNFPDSDFICARIRKSRSRKK